MEEDCAASVDVAMETADPDPVNDADKREDGHATEHCPQSHKHKNKEFYGQCFCFYLQPPCSTFS